MNDQHDDQYPKNVFTFNGPSGYSSEKGTPFQISIGPTYQGSANQYKGYAFSDTKIYPAHCHQGTEIYKFLDPVGLIRDQGDGNKNVSLNNILANDFSTYRGVPIEPFSYNSSSSSPTYVTDHTRTFVNYMYNLWPNGFKETGLGSWSFNDARDYHAMHNGEWMQLTSWSRLTNPLEGTYFPLNGGSQPPDGNCKQPI